LNHSLQLKTALSNQNAPDGLSAGTLAAPLDALVDSPLGITGLWSGAETILFVEDESFVREVTSEVLRSAGYTVITAKNGAEALRIFHQRSEAAELLLSDIVLPGKSGHALAGELRQLCPEIIVLFISGYADQWAQSEYEKEGAHFLAKPFSMPALLHKVREALDGHRAQTDCRNRFKPACGNG
jgi:DNA-binding NtrC family response regulator